MSSYFCDSLGDVSIVNGVARLEFQRLVTVAAAGENRELQAVSELTVAIPLQGFAQILNLLNSVRDRLVREGILKTDGGEINAAAGAPASDRSPNF